MIATRSNSTQLREIVAASPGRVDTEAGIIRNVRILGPKSANGREYTLDRPRDCPMPQHEFPAWHPDFGRRVPNA